MFVIPLGFALGSKGDAFRAKRGKNPWVRFPAENNKGSTAPFIVIPLGFEPKAHSVEGCCSLQLSYGTNTVSLSV